MNIASNMLGLGNAATPFGIKAMQELDSLNPHKGTATNAMVLFLAINTSNVALAPPWRDCAEGVDRVRKCRRHLVAHPAGHLILDLRWYSRGEALAEAARIQHGATEPAEQEENISEVGLPDEETLGTEQPTSRPGCLLAIASVGAIGVGLSPIPAIRLEQRSDLWAIAA